MLPMNQPLIKSILCGITEITNGIYLISTLNASPVFRLILIVVINAFGGISTIMQTAGITKGCQMNIKKYIYYKFILAILTLANTLFIIYVL
jgi:choline-glycine betaine transporter